MTARRPRTAEGDTATAVVLEIFRVNGLLLADGNRLATAEGLTAARWQVLGAVALAGRPLTVPQIARRMGLTRQAVQESVNRLLAGALVEARDNLDHRRSPLIGLTELGSQKYTAVDQRQARWINELAAGLKIADLAVAARLLRELGDRLENNEDTAGEGNSDDIYLGAGHLFEIGGAPLEWLLNGAGLRHYIDGHAVELAGVCRRGCEREHRSPNGTRPT